MQRVACPNALSSRVTLGRPQLRRTAMTCSRPALSVRSAAGASQPPVSNPIIRLAAAAVSMLQATKQRMQQAVAEAVRQTNEEVGGGWWQPASYF